MSDTELTPQAREVLDAARAVPCAPDHTAIERMHQAVLLATAAGAAGVASAAGASAGKAGLGALGTKLIIVSSVAVLAIGGAVVVKMNSVSPESTVVDDKGLLPHPAPLPEGEGVPSMSPSPAPAGEGQGEGETIEVTPKTVEPRVIVTSKPPPAPVVVAKEEPSPPPAPSEPGPNDAYTRELALLERARAQLQAREWSAVLESISAHDTEFPNGALNAEAEVLRILSLCEVNRVSEALEHSKQLQRTAGRSPALLRLAGSCVEP
ncbi:MAG: hypothetical protein JNM17_36955 [Archangium sp.]|nr:hypothetical protein [Archangium sp.]